MNMNGYIRLATVVAVLFFAGTVRMQAQTVKGQSPDSLALSMSTVMDSTLMGKSIFSILPGSGRNGSQSVVSVNQSDAVLKALNSHIAANSDYHDKDADMSVESRRRRRVFKRKKHKDRY